MIDTFADDTVLSSHKNVKTAVENLQQTVDALMQWFKIWHLNVNYDKSLQVIFTTKTKYVPIPIIINGKDVSIVNSANSHMMTKAIHTEDYIDYITLYLLV